MSRITPRSKTLRQYRKEQKTKRIYCSGADFEDYLLLAGDNAALPEQSLWRAVILQMVTDALSNSKKYEQTRWRKEAISWLTSHSRDFCMVAEHAGYESDWLQEHIDKFLALHRESQQSQDKKPAPITPHFSISYQLQPSPHIPSLEFTL